jgi:hypothetical protein
VPLLARTQAVVEEFEVEEHEDVADLDGKGRYEAPSIVRRAELEELLHCPVYLLEPRLDDAAQGRAILPEGLLDHGRIEEEVNSPLSDLEELQRGHLRTPEPALISPSGIGNTIPQVELP